MSKLLERTLKRTPLDVRLRVHLIADDIDNWSNGEYSGTEHKKVNGIIDIVHRWVKDRAPISNGETGIVPAKMAGDGVIMELLNEYSMFLESNGYLDTDWRTESTYAIDMFMQEWLERYPTNESSQT